MALASGASAEENKTSGLMLPPNDGKFFYADMRAGKYFGQHYIDVSAGDEIQNLWLTSNQHELSMISEDCLAKECDVPDKLKAKNSEHHFRILDEGELEVTGRLVEGYRMRDIKFKGYMAFEKLGLALSEFDRNTHLPINFFEITEASQYFKTDYNGFLGFKPHFVLDQRKKDMNVMYRLKDKGRIDYNILSVYVSEEEGKSSIIKFGGWDQISLKNGTELHMFKAATKSSWHLISDSITFAGKNLLTAEDSSFGGRTVEKKDRFINIDPMVPYVTVPSSDFELIKKQLMSLKEGVECPSGLNGCKINNKCEEVRDASFDLKMVLKDGETSKVFELDEYDMLIDGAELGLDPNTCYFAIVSAGISVIESTWYVGGSFLNKYYVVYDLTPADERGEDYIQIGIGEKNPEKLATK